MTQLAVSRPLGKLLKELHEFQVLLRLVTDDKSSDGNAVKELQAYQASAMSVTSDVLMAGNRVMLEQLAHVAFITVTSDVLISGKLVVDPGLLAILSRLEQPLQVLDSVVAFEKLSSSNDSSAVQFCQVEEKLVPVAVLISGKLVRPEHPLQALLKLTPAEVLICGKLVRLEHSRHALAKSVTF